METLNQINEIAQSLSGFLIPLIAIIMLSIAYQQYRINHNRLKFDLYDKRFKVYYSLMGLISYVTQTGTTTKEETDKFRIDIYESKFLFDKKVYDYLNTIYNNAKEFQYKDEKIAKARTPDEREKLLNEKDKIFDWFVDRMEESHKLFSSYLTISLESFSLHEKNTRLGGWHRLWILISLIYLSLIIAYDFIAFPKPEKISHTSEFYEKLPLKSLEMIVVGGKTKNIIDPLEVTEVEMPNRHIILFSNKFSQEEMKGVAREYWEIVIQKTREKRIRFLVSSFLFWMVSCTLIYAFGWGIGWVYKGFKST